MRDLLLYIIFIIFVVAVICVHLYMGTLKQHCVKKPMSAMSAAAWSEFTSNPGAGFNAIRDLFSPTSNGHLFVFHPV